MSGFCFFVGTREPRVPTKRTEISFAFPESGSEKRKPISFEFLGLGFWEIELNPPNDCSGLFHRRFRGDDQSFPRRPGHVKCLHRGFLRQFDPEFVRVEDGFSFRKTWGFLAIKPSNDDVIHSPGNSVVLYFRGVEFAVGDRRGRRRPTISLRHEGKECDAARRHRLPRESHFSGNLMISRWGPLEQPKVKTKNAREIPALLGRKVCGNIAQECFRPFFVGVARSGRSLADGLVPHPEEMSAWGESCLTNSSSQDRLGLLSLPRRI